MDNTQSTINMSTYTNINGSSLVFQELIYILMFVDEICVIYTYNENVILFYDFFTPTQQVRRSA